MSLDARDLHAGLGVTGTRFNDWLNRRVISNPEFNEWVDYETYDGLRYSEVSSPKARPQKTVECLLSLDTAKRVAMAEGGEVGKLVRSGFAEGSDQSP